MKFIIRDITAHVSDRNTGYFDNNHQSVHTGSKYGPLFISEKANSDNFKTGLKLQQRLPYFL